MLKSSSSSISIGLGADGVEPPPFLNDGRSQGLVLSQDAFGITERWKCRVCALAPVYFTHRHGLKPGRVSRIKPLAMMYLIRGSREATSSSVKRSMSTPFFGSWVMSIAVTMPGPYHGLWSLLRFWWLVSPMVPSLALFLLGNAALIWSRRVSSDLATLHVIPSLSGNGSQ